jgi:zinc/manganese transport system substrate-binding protein
VRRFWLISLMLATAIFPARAQDRLNVVASFSILGDFVHNVGGDRVNVTTLVGPNSDVHVYSPAPADAKKVADAKLVFVNGLGLEGWLPRLVQSSGGKATIVTASQGIAPFRANSEAYQAELDALDREVRAAVAQIPQGRRKVISTHDAFGYFASAYGVEFIAPLGVSTESEASARDIAGIITQIKTAKIPAVFLENITDPRLMQRIASETGARVGGTLYSDSLTGEKGDAPTYIDMVRHNIKALTSALAK